MIGSIFHILKSEDGATAIEYGLIASLISIAAIATMTTLGASLRNTFSAVSSALDAGISAGR